MRSADGWQPCFELLGLQHLLLPSYMSWPSIDLWMDRSLEFFGWMIGWMVGWLDVWLESGCEFLEIPRGFPKPTCRPWRPLRRFLNASLALVCVLKHFETCEVGSKFARCFQCFHNLSVIFISMIFLNGGGIQFSVIFISMIFLNGGGIQWPPFTPGWARWPHILFWICWEPLYGDLRPSFGPWGVFKKMCCEVMFEHLSKMSGIIFSYFFSVYYMLYYIFAVLVCFAFVFPFGASGHFSCQLPRHTHCGRRASRWTTSGCWPRCSGTCRWSWEVDLWAMRLEAQWFCDLMHLDLVDRVEHIFLIYVYIYNVSTIYQWEFQDPKLEVRTLYKAYVRPM